MVHKENPDWRAGVQGSGQLPMSRLKDSTTHVACIHRLGRGIGGA